MAKNKKITTEERLKNLKQQQKECEILYQRLQGAIDLLTNMIEDHNEKTD